MNELQIEIKACLQDELCGMLGILADNMAGHIKLCLEGAGIELDDQTVNDIAERLCNAMNDWLNGQDNESVRNTWSYVLEGIK